MTAETRFSPGATRQPPVQPSTRGTPGAFNGAVCLHAASQVWKLMAPGTPVNGASGTGATWAGPGSEYTDQTAGKLYINTGTAASPTWTVVGSQT